MQAAVSKRQMKARPEYKGIPMVNVNITYPQVITNGSPTGEAISGFYSETASVYYTYSIRDLYNIAENEYINSRKNKVPFRTYTAMMAYEIPYNRNDFLSVFLDVYEFTGGANGITVRSANAWSLKTGRHMQLADFFLDASYQGIIFGSIIAQINEQISKNINVYFEGWQKNVFKYFNERNFYLTDEGFAVYFPIESIAPHSSGIVTFIIPYQEFKGILKYSI